MKIYLDTSVISAYFDSGKPQRQQVTRIWFERQFQYHSAYVSDLVIQELEATSNIELRNKFIDFVKNLPITNLMINNEIMELAELYRKLVIPNEYNDSIHIAAATLYGFDAIVSWNFRHIVNLETIKFIHEINIKNGLSVIEIVSLNELNGEDYGESYK